MDPEMLKSFPSSQGTSSITQPLKKFYRGEPMALGITQVFIGILEIAFGFVIDSAYDNHFYHIHYKTPHWSGIVYIISGSLSVAAAKNPKIPLVKGALGINAVSAVAAGFGIVVSSISLAVQTPPIRHFFGCDHEYNDTKMIQACHELETIPYATSYNISVILLVLTVLEFFIAIVSSAFACDTVCRNAFSETTIVIFQNTPEASPPPQPAP